MDQWLLDPEVIHLNHGSFGACPKTVLDVQQSWRQTMERNPVLFFSKRLQPALDAARKALGAFVGADPAGLVFVSNATAGVNAVLRSMEPRLGPGDEILVTDHAYNACRNIVAVAAQRSGAALVEVTVGFPVESAADVGAALLGRISPATRLVMVDAVSSPTALVVPL
jgi:isopenicillin-N epimerase